MIESRRVVGKDTVAVVLAGSKLACSRKYPPISGAKKSTAENTIRNMMIATRSLVV
jgi:hypothetical protein